MWQFRWMIRAASKSSAAFLGGYPNVNDRLLWTDRANLVDKFDPVTNQPYYVNPDRSSRLARLHAIEHRHSQSQLLH
jgi:hypothetical protein